MGEVSSILEYGLGLESYLKIRKVQVPKNTWFYRVFL